MDEQSKNLSTLKQQIIEELSPLIDQRLSPAEKFESYFAIASALGTEESITKAFAAAKEIAEASEKSRALLSLLDLVSEMQDQYTGAQTEETLTAENTAEDN